jgi:hypothetical protein
MKEAWKMKHFHAARESLPRLLCHHNDVGYNEINVITKEVTLL